MPSTDILQRPEQARARRLKEARLQAGFETAAGAATHFQWNRNTYSSNENGNAVFSYRMAKRYAEAFGVDFLWLHEGIAPTDADAPPARPPSEILVPVIGKVGADTEGRVLFATGQDAGDLVPLPPGGTDKAVALQIVGHSMRGVADEGGLIYFEDQRTPPTPDMFGHVVVVETLEGEVLVKRLLRGSRSGRFDLESVAGPTRENAKIRWAAHITAIIPPHQARRILRIAGV
ncbi:peptidase S24 [Phenylobacterium sp.]|uniref:LexA family transcriptional regulator n=1 Tax=Phenylobacterium sp. TaxID=1871053 RepID=UPI00289A6FC1|nr:peptidase S24 [Phenylobacterium sp.]